MKIDIPNVTNSRYFGPVSKAVWYGVIDEYNPYILNFSINLLPNLGVGINILNRFNARSNPEYIRFFPPSTTGIIETRIELFHIPNYKSRFYAVLNRA